MSSYSLVTDGPGFVVHQTINGQPHAWSDHPLSYRDACRQLRALELAEDIANRGVDQEGEGLIANLRDAALKLTRQHVNRKLGLHHVQNVSKVIQHLGKHHAGVQDEDADLASASKDAYNKPDARAGPGYMRGLSNDEIAVYNRGGRHIVAFRGSARNEDIKTDAKLALGQLEDTPRWQRTVKHMKRIRKALGPSFEYTGHSLGGTLAQHAYDLDKARGASRSVAFNPGATILGRIPAKNQRVYTVKGDLVSTLATATHNDVRVLPAAGGPGADLLSAHTIDNFVP